MSKESSGLFNGTSGSSNRNTNVTDFFGKSGKTQSEIKSIANMVLPNLPANPNTLISKGWKDTTPAPMKAKTNSTKLHDPATGLDIRFDKGEPGAPGFKGKDHYHVENPNSTGKGDKYLDKDGNPCAKGSKASHILPGGK